MKSFAAFLIVSTLAYLAMSQSSCTSPSGCAYCALATTILPASVCTQCSTGFFLANSTTTCTLCPPGCSSCSNSSWCLACNTTSYAYWATTGACVQLPTNCIAGAATSATATTCSTCPPGYALVGTAGCASCSTATNTIGTAVWYGILNCAFCTATTPTAVTTHTGAPVGNWLQCSVCNNGYQFLKQFANVGTSATTYNGITTSVCWLETAVLSATVATQTQTASILDGNDYDSTAYPILAPAPTGCLAQIGASTATLPYAFTTGASTTPLCTSATAGTWCLTTASTGTITCGAASAPTVTGTAWANCTGGTYAGTAAAPTTSTIQCNQCASGSQLLVSSSGTTCVWILPGCYWMSSSTTCLLPATGYVWLPNGTLYNTVGQYLTTASTTAVASAGPIANCLIYNTTSICVFCAPYYYAGTSSNALFLGSVCVACQSGCNNCSSLATCNSGGCASGYIMATNNTCQKSNCTNISSNGTCLYSKNIVASGLAFVSMIFYYIF